MGLLPCNGVASSRLETNFEMCIPVVPLCRWLLWLMGLLEGVEGMWPPFLTSNKIPWIGGCRASKVPGNKHFGVQRGQNPWKKAALLGAERAASLLSGPLNRLNAILSLLLPLDRYRTPSAIGSAIGRPLSRPISHPNTGGSPQPPRSKPLGGLNHAIVENPFKTSAKQKHDRGRDSQPRPRPRLNSQPPSLGLRVAPVARTRLCHRNK